MSQICYPLPPLQLGNTLGAAFIGNVIAAVLYGLTSLQTYMFFERYDDGPLLKLLVSFLWVLDTVHLGLITHTIYFYAVTNFNDPLVMTRVTTSIMAHVIVTGVSDVTIRGIFAFRVWLVSQRKLALVAIIAMSSMVTLAGSIAFPVKGLQLGTYAAFSQISWILYMAFGAGVVADVTIAAALCYYLARRKTGVRRTDSMVQWLMLYSVNTGALTSVCAICVLICYALMPANFVFIAFYFVLPKLFLNSLLATLNARQKLRAHGAAANGLVSIPLSSRLNSGSGPRTPGASDLGHNARMLEVQIETTTDMRSDSMKDVSSEKWKPSPYPSP